MTRSTVLCWVLTCSAFGVAFGQQQPAVRRTTQVADAETFVVETKQSDWHGFQKQSFTLDGDPGFVVVPKIAAPGKPWIWRTSFPDFHAEVDRELVRNGYHIGFLNVVKALGSDESLDKMDRFYDLVRSQWGLAEKPALEPCSRGGLHAYRYAARHPERIACILGDVPVMDLKSWPVKWPGSKQQILDAMHHYGFESEKELMEFDGNPIDMLEPIAKAKIPLRHVICLTDKVVPPEENSLEAKRRLIALGHDLELAIVKDSDQTHGHHFPYPNVFESVRFVMRHACVLPDDNDGHRSDAFRDAQPRDRLRGRPNTRAD